MLTFPLIIPAIPWIIGVIFTLLGGVLIVTHSKKTDGKTLGVLGMSQAGKSRFLSNLGLFPYSDEATNIKDYKEHTYKVKDREIKIMAGQDVGGDVDIKRFYNQWVTEKDITIFIFDGPLFLKDQKYAKDVKSRLWRRLRFLQHCRNSFTFRPIRRR